MKPAPAKLAFIKDFTENMIFIIYFAVSQNLIEMSVHSVISSNRYIAIDPFVSLKS